MRRDIPIAYAATSLPSERVHRVGAHVKERAIRLLGWVWRVIVWVWTALVIALGLLTLGVYLGRRQRLPQLDVGEEGSEEEYLLAPEVPADEGNAIRIDALNLKKFGPDRATLLNNISLSIPPRTFVAVVGASGVGKSLLLDALSGRRPAQQGKVLYNGQDYYRHLAAFRSRIGYVPQDDIVHRDLSVERALYYAAKLRLPGDYSNEQVWRRIGEVLEDMELTEQRKHLVKTLSGGQRKRVSIAIELLAKPSLFFLDEPTSGLDPGLDHKMMRLLRKLVDKGHTIILVTHTVANINVCDYVCFLAHGGRLAYFGPPDEAKVAFGKSDFSEIYASLDPTNGDPHTSEEAEARFRLSSMYQEYVAKPLRANAGAVMGHLQPRQSTRPRHGRPWRQFVLLTLRYAELMRNDAANLVILLLQAPVIATLLVFLIDQRIIASPAGHETAAQTPLFIMAVAATWFGTINAAREIVKEAPIYRRERAVNLGLVPYVLSKVFVLGMLCLVQSLLLLVIVGLKGGYPAHGLLLPVFFDIYLSLALAALGGLTMGLTISAIAPNADRAMSLVPLVLLPQMIFAGNSFKLSGGTELLSFLMVARWALVALGSIADLHSPVCFSPLTKSMSEVPAGGCRPGTTQVNPTVNTPLSFYKHTAEHVLLAWGMLALLILIFLGLTLYFQKRKDAQS